MIEELTKALKFIESIDITKYDLALEDELNKNFSIVEKLYGDTYSKQYLRFVGNPQPILLAKEWENRTRNDYENKEFEAQLKISLNNLKKLFKTLIMLEPLAKVKNENIIVVGANGSGKSSFANYLGERRFFDNLSVVPAQKILHFINSHSSLNVENVRNSQASLKLKNQSIDDGKISLRLLFSNLIVAMIDDETQHAVRFKNEFQEGAAPPVTFFDRFKSIFQKIFTGVDFELETSTRNLLPIKNEQQYELNAMSDGEKVAIYYILNVLLAVDQSYIIIDEPETYLNQNISSKLWNLLESERPDCQFVYITHNVDFINSRNNAQIFWLQSGNTQTQVWELEKVEQNELPNDLLISLLGNQKSIIFCEGHDKSSWDYKLYEALFGDQYTVYPVGGCEEVIKYTRTYNKASSINFNNDAIGIVDFDLRDTEEIAQLKTEEIFCNSQANEIEPVLLLPEILTTVLKKYFPENHSQMIQEFQNKLVNLLDDERDKIILTSTKRMLENKLMTEKLSMYKTKEAMRQNFLTLFTDDYFQEVYSKGEKFVSMHLKKTYIDSLKICNLKGEVIGLLKNSFNGPDFALKDYYSLAIKEIQSNQELRNLIKTQYYSFINNES